MDADPQNDRSAKVVADYYDQVAETWDETVGAARHNPRFARQLRASLNDLLSPAAGRSVGLELGAGTGPYVDVTSPLFGKLIATDFSRGMLDVFARRIARLELQNVVLLRQDACDLDAVASASVDAVYSIGLLETVPDPDRLFAESYRVLKPGGLVAGITSNGACPWYWLRRRLEGGERHGRTGRLATAGGLERVLAGSGFVAPAFFRWGAVPPGMRDGLLSGVLAAAETVVTPTPLARFLAVLGFRARKPHPP